ncbi:hypothetical protein PBY51_015216 [Eleginops maclovinus]|uniref:Uncharacterized protein n=1 Tax=Eleginops maclovinus TaxID=56733 RepID=A0AAN7X6A4_ELEMC|nr:hypothetical protein PBY51_015216 [Eleginops maclovinus]
MGFTAEVRVAKRPSCGTQGLKHGLTSSERDLRPQGRCQLQMEGTPGWIKPVIQEPPLVSELNVTALCPWDSSQRQAGPRGRHMESHTQRSQIK